ncbi:Glyoxalase/Bleomycin resistance protein/Dioxygenase superfamily protein [Paracidovorax cattleyae]|uniref:Glyoxalase/Bleomycin resistance protein/Dioxygenase superfamily protein n=2 Tax=Paracidovorax cattleyae TaxID=80868 RepID=A0A1H0WAP5_9BURK|nr:Glyoxalase/Bleomycin resistance protein/Dioxygenase superfamily protein [Paracidovorax cattleyae]
MGIYTDQQDEMQAFYERVIGLAVSDQGVAQKFKRRIVFMTASPLQHHQFVLVQRQPEDPPRGPLFQVSFKVQSLAALRVVHARALEHGARNFRPLNHGNSWSLYFNDPEDNVVEVYLETPWYLPQPFADDLDLSLDDAEIERLTEARVLACPGACTAEAWSQRMGQRLEPSTPTSTTSTPAAPGAARATAP